jgi:hypothetical protein
MIWYDMIRYDMIWYDMIWYNIDFVSIDISALDGFLQVLLEGRLFVSASNGLPFISSKVSVMKRHPSYWRTSCSHLTRKLDEAWIQIEILWNVSGLPLPCSSFFRSVLRLASPCDLYPHPFLTLSDLWQLGWGVCTVPCFSRRRT